MYCRAQNAGSREQTVGRQTVPNLHPNVEMELTK
jgi:hypothetical protein